MLSLGIDSEKSSVILQRKGEDVIILVKICLQKKMYINR